MAFRTNKTPVLQTKSASGAVASFNTALAMPLVNGEFTIEAYQEGTGDPAPDNVRNIVGFDKLRIDMVNFNQFTRNGNFATGDIWTTFTSYGTISVNNNECIYTFTGIENSRYLNSLRYSLYIIPTHKYFFSSDYYVTKPSKALVYDIGNSKIKDKTLAVGWNRVQEIMDADIATEGNKSCYIGLEFCEDYNYQVGDTYKMKNVMCIDLTQLFGSRIADYLYNLENNQEGAGVAIFKQLFYKDYYDYNVGGTWVSVASVNGDSYPDYAEVALGEDVYGGSYRSDTGDKKKTHKDIIYNGSENWLQNTQGYFYVSRPSNSKVGTITSLCNMFKNYASVSELLDKGFYIGNNNIVFRYDGISLNDFKTLISNTNLQVVYELAEPIESNIGATEIETFNGSNNIFCDTGDTSVTYKDLDIAKRGNFREVFKLPS